MPNSLDKLATTLGRLNNILEKLDNTVKKKEKKIKTEKDASQQHLDKEREEYQKRKEELILREEKLSQKLIKNARDYVGVLDKQEKKYHKIIEANRELIEFTKSEKVQNQQEIIEIYEKKIEETKKLIKELNKIQEIAEGTKSSWKNLSQTFFGMTEESDSWISTLNKGVKAGVSGWKAMFLQSLDSVKNEFLNVGNVAIGAISKTEESMWMLANEQMNAYAEFQKLTGAGEEYTKTIDNVYESTRQYGVSAQEAAESMGSLHTSFIGFNQLSTSTQKQFGILSSKLNEIGISTDVSAQSMETMTSALGLSAGQTEKNIRQLADLGASLGNASKAFDDFNSAMSTMAVYGDEAVEVFTQLQLSSKALKVDFGELLSITTQFHTFEGAANAAAGLNAILGGGLLNSTQLLNATEEESIRLIIQSMELSGKRFDQLNKHEQRAIAAAAGIQDMATANKIFNMSLSAYDNYLIKADETAQSQAELEERARQVHTIMDELKVIIYQTAIALYPLIQIVKEGVVWFIELNESLNGWVIPAIGGLFLAIQAIKGLMASTTAVMSIFGKSTAVAGKGAESGLGSIGKGLHKLAVMGTKAIPVLLGIGAGMVMVGAGIALAVGSLAFLVYTVSDVEANTINTLLTLTLMLGVLGGVAIFASEPMLILGAAMLLVGSGIALVGAGVYLMSDGLETVVEQINNVNVGNLVALSGALVLFSGALAITIPLLTALGLMAPIAFAGFGVLAAGIWLLQEAFANDEELEMFATLFESLAKITEEADKLRQIPDIISDVVSRLNELNDVKSITTSILSSWIMTFGAGSWLEQMKGLNTVLEPVEKIVSNTTQEKVEQVHQISQSIQTIAKSTKNPSEEQVGFLKQIMSSIGSVDASSPNINISVYLDSKEITRNVKTKIEKDRFRTPAFLRKVRNQG